MYRHILTHGRAHIHVCNHKHTFMHADTCGCWPAYLYGNSRAPPVKPQPSNKPFYRGRGIQTRPQGPTRPGGGKRSGNETPNKKAKPFHRPWPLRRGGGGWAAGAQPCTHACTHAGIDVFMHACICTRLCQVHTLSNIVINTTLQKADVCIATYVILCVNTNSCVQLSTYLHLYTACSEPIEP